MERLTKSYTELLSQEVWKVGPIYETMTVAQQVRLSYLRAKSIAQHINMTVTDINHLSPKFWNFHSNLITGADSAATVILTIHWNLCMGTIAMHGPTHPRILEILDRLARFDLCGEFMLTELGHGLDARNIQTLATLQDDGSFDLHTPDKSAAKVMPPTTLWAGMPRVAVVFAILVVDGEQRGLRPFLVHINDTDKMRPGISCRALPARPGAKVLDHAVTSFHHVRLSRSSLLSGPDDLELQDSRKELFRHIRRVTVGTLSLSMTYTASLRQSGYVAGRYSQKRRIAGKDSNETVPIVTFTTQHRPVIAALTQASILEAFANWTTGQFVANSASPRVQGALACVFKETAIHFGQATMSELIDRCGWQGLFTFNQVCELALAQRGASVAEGDTLVLCIRLVTELVLGRCTLPEPSDPNSLLARHEKGVWDEAGKVVESIMGLDEKQRDEGFNTFLLPRCRQLIQATGQRMAYEAAKAAPDIRPEMIRLWEAMCVEDDPSWYVVNTNLDRTAIFERHSEAVKALLPLLDKLLEETEAEAWTTAPFLDDKKWSNFLDGLELFGCPGVPGDQRDIFVDHGLVEPQVHLGSEEGHVQETVTAGA